MKTWHKVAIGIGGFLIIGCLIVSCLAIIFGYKFGKDFSEGFTNPEVKLKQAREICNFDLPENYDIAFTMDLYAVKLATIRFKPSNQMIILIQMPQSERITSKEFREMPKEELREEFSKNQTGNLVIKKIKDMDIYTVNGHEIPYFEAEFEDNGKPSEGIFANYECSDTKKIFFILAMNEKGKYENSVTWNFLKNIKCH